MIFTGFSGVFKDDVCEMLPVTWSGLKLKLGYFKNFYYNIKEPFLSILK